MLEGELRNASMTFTMVLNGVEAFSFEQCLL